MVEENDNQNVGHSRKQITGSAVDKKYRAKIIFIGFCSGYATLISANLHNFLTM